MKTPEFYQEEDFRVVIWRDKGNNYEPERARSVPEACQSVPEEAKELLNLIKENPNISRARLSEILHISVRQVRNIIESLKSCGILTRQGGDSGRWIINSQNIKSNKPQD